MTLFHSLKSICCNFGGNPEVKIRSLKNAENNFKFFLFFNCQVFKFSTISAASTWSYQMTLKSQTDSIGELL